jgi:OOP family OmpA-OmpF porin
MKKTIFAVLAGFVAMGAAQAQTATTATTATAPAADTAPHAYIGIGMGSAHNTIAGERKSVVKLFGGYDFDRNWGIEGGYARFAGTDWYYGMQDGGFGHANMDSYGAYVAGKYTFPISEHFSAYAKLGVAHTENKVRGTGQGWNYTERDNGLYSSLGLQYKLNEKVSLVGEYERYGKRKPNGPEDRVWSAGLKYSF